MSELVLDACAALHMRKLALSSGGATLLVERLLPHGLCIVLTAAVEGECVEMSLRSAIQRWRDAGTSVRSTFRHQRVTRNERKALLNRVKRGKHRMPGRKDVDLVVLSDRLAVPFLTHDDAAAALAERVGVTTLDVLDLAELLVRRSHADEAEMEHLLAGMARMDWQPADWRGGFRATMNARPHREWLQKHLHEWLAQTDR